MTGTWSLGTLIGLPIASIVILAALVGAVWAAIVGIRKRDGEAKGFAVGAGVFAMLIAIGTVFAMWPFSAEYHRWEPKRFVVQEVNRRLISDGDHSMNERIAAEAKDGQVYGCDDTRCSLVKPGDTLILLCKREYQWSGVPGWECNFGRVIHRG